MYQQRSSRLARGQIDLREPLTDHPLNFGRLLWWLALPGRFGGKYAWELVRGYTFKMPTFSAGQGWSTLSGRGGFGSLQFSNNNFGASGPNVADNLAAFTCGFWINIPSGSTQSSQPLGKGNYFSGPGWGIAINDTNGNGVFSPFTFDGGSNFQSAFTNTAYNDGKWHRVICTIAARTANWAIYVDGVNASSTVSNGGSITGFSTAIAIGIGGDTVESTGNFTGGINDAFVSVGVWSAKMVALDYELGLQGYPGVLRRRQHKAYSVPSSPPAGSPPPMLALLGCGA